MYLVDISHVVCFNLLLISFVIFAINSLDFMSVISGSHGGEYEDDSLLGYNALYSH
jgi:hypothetical protein